MDWRAIGLGLAFVLMWSSAFTSARIAVADAPPFLLLAVRFLLSGVIAVGLAAWLGQRIPRKPSAYISLALFGISQNVLYLGLNFVAMLTVEATLAVLVASLLPLSVAAARWALVSEQPSMQAAFGLTIGLAGVALVAGARLSGGTDPVGMMFCVLGLCALTAATLLVRGATGEGNLLMVIGLQMLVGSATLLPLSLIFETWEVRWTVSLGLAFTYTTLVPGLLATLTWFVLLRRVGETRAASFHFLNPCFGVLVAYLVLGEQLSLRDMLGVAIIMAGILAVQTAPRRHPSSPQ